ncbi:hypothetical protein NQ317_012661 [Molorchus minor]|uniref:Uncharacterized protein n=1 Tax=Molorchus minor TaxID=1323400 RepID=A0ABQ9JLC9_9CUCU|nr:hypothetical protein NQ317_012661 [Molorchus minor]
MQPKKSCSILVYLCVTSLLFLTAGIVLLCVWELVYNFIVSGNLILQPSSTAYSMWIKNPIPLSLKLYVFNWTNPTDIYNSSIKPKFQQLGPYTYGETKEKSSITWNANNTVTFKHLKKWYFDAERSNGSLYDMVTSINPIALSAAYASRNWNYLFRKGFSVTFDGIVNSTIVVTRSVGEVLFDGYDDSLINIAKTFPFLAGSSLPPMDKFGWFYGAGMGMVLAQALRPIVFSSLPVALSTGIYTVLLLNARSYFLVQNSPVSLRNGSEDFEGTFNMDTGVTGQLGQLYNWKYANHTPYYRGHCGALNNASAGEFFPTNLRKDSTLKFFSADLCRYVELEFEKEETVHGIVGYKYSAGDKFLDNGTKIPENRCFCDGQCMPSGALNVSACRYGSPAFVSLPHFNKADPYYRDIIEGTDPNEDQHNFYMVLEPKTAVPLKVAARLQLNLRMQEVRGISLYEKVPTVYIPVLWFEQVVTIPDSLAFGIKVLLNFKVMCWAISIIAIGIGVLIMICVFYKLCSSELLDRKSKRQHVKEEVPLKREPHIFNATKCKS